jgi:hypothetical protein
MAFMKIRWAKKVRIRRISERSPREPGWCQRGIRLAGSMAGLLLDKSLFSIA